MIYSKINKKSIKTEFNNTPYVIVKNLKLKDMIAETRRQMLNILRNEAPYEKDLITRIEERSKSFINKFKVISSETKFMVNEDDDISIKNIVPSKYMEEVTDKPAIIRSLTREDCNKNRPVFRTLNGVDKNVFKILANNDEVMHISYLDKDYFRLENNYSSKNKSILNSYQYGSRYFYVDRNNIKSFIRPIFNIKTDYREICEYFGMYYKSTDYTYVNNAFLRDKDDFRPDLLLEEFLLNKIIITKFKRVNTSLGNIITNTNSGQQKINYISNYIKTCPILQSYLENGYKILHMTDEEDISNIKTNILNNAYQKLKNYDTILNSEVNFNVDGSFIVDVYDAINIENEYRKTGNDNNEVINRKNVSIILVKVDYIDLYKAGIEKENCVYIPEHDIVIGEINDNTVNNRFNILEEISHPYSGYTDITTDMYKDRKLPVILDYVVNNNYLHKPLYVNVFGTVEQLLPRRDPKLKEGVYVKSTNDKRFINPEDYGKYGIFFTEELAEDYIGIINSTDNNKQLKEYLDNKLAVKKIEIEEAKLKHEKEKMLFTSNAMLTDQLEKKIKAKIEEKTTTVKFLKEIFSVSASIISSIVTILVLVNKQKS